MKANQGLALLYFTSLMTFCVTTHADEDARTSPDSKAVDVGAKPATWYSMQKNMYFGIQVGVRFLPADDALASNVWAALEAIDGVYNDYRDDTEIGRLNLTRERERVTLSEDLAEGFQKAIELHRLTDGACDISVGPLRRLWKKAAKDGKVPTEDEIRSARDVCGLGKIGLHGRELSVSVPGMKFDFGGVAKGMAVDRAMAILRHGGVKAALVQVGGETGCFGMSMRGKPHSIGIQHPKDAEDIWTSLVDPGAGLSASTSGNYAQPIQINGQTFYHIYNPSTGVPADTRILSASVVFRGVGKNWLADGMTKAPVVLGPDRALPLIEKAGGEALILLQTDNGIVERKTSGWDLLTAKKAQ